MKYKLLVISSPEATERRARIGEMLDQLSIDWEFVYAGSEEVDQLDYNFKASLRHAGRELLRGELGCYASHYKCWKILESYQHSDYMMVIEDDVFIDTAFDFDGVVDLMHKCRIEYIRLYSRVMPQKKLIGSYGYRKIYRFKDVAYGTQCYLISKLGAKKLIKQAEQGVSRPVDDEMDRFWSNKLSNLALFPYPVLELSYNSTIRAKKSLVTAKGIDSVYFRFQLKLNGYLRKIYNLYWIQKDRKLKQIILQLHDV